MKLLSVLFIVLAMLLNACGDSPTPAPGAVVEVTRMVEVTKIVEVTKVVTVLVTAPAPPPTVPPAATTVAVTTIAPTKTSVPAATSTPIANTTLTALASASVSGESVKELIGQSADFQDQKIQVIAADRYKEIVGKSKTVKSQGEFIIVEFSVDNSQGKKPGGTVFASLIDGKGRTYSVSTSDALIIIITEEPYRSMYKIDSTIQPGFKGQSFQIFEVPSDAKDFKVKIGF